MNKLLVGYIGLLGVLGASTAGMFYAEDAHASHGCFDNSHVKTVVRVGPVNPQAHGSYPISCKLTTCEVVGASRIAYEVRDGVTIAGATYRPILLSSTLPICPGQILAAFWGCCD